MGDILSIVVIMLGLATAVFVLLTANPKTSRKLTIFAGILALLGGLAVYGYGYCSKDGIGLQAMLHALFSVFRIFIGDADFSEVADYFTGSTLLALIWLLHVLGFYATSSAAISLIGANALRNLRVRLARKEDLNIIYGINPDSVEFGQALVEDAKALVVFVAEDPDSTLSESILESGGVLRSDNHAISGNKQFLKSLGLRKGKRQLTLYTLHKDAFKNMEYAKLLLEGCKDLDLSAEQMSLVIHAREDDSTKQLQVSKDRLGYGFISIFQEASLTGRLLMQKYPPCRSISFNEEGIAQDDFEAIIIGFGKIGQTVLRQLVMNGQFIGSTFRADVFDPDAEALNGHFVNSYPDLLKHYNIQFHSHDGRSQELYKHLNDRMDKIKYIVLCTGNEQRNDEIEEELRSYLLAKGKKVCIMQCYYRGIKSTDPETNEPLFHKLYHPDVLATKKLDLLAMAINHHYMGDSDRGPVAEWMDCDYFSRMSNRAYADFVDSVLHILKLNEDKVLNGNWIIPKDIMDKWQEGHNLINFFRERAIPEERIAQWRKDQKLTTLLDEYSISKQDLDKWREDRDLMKLLNEHPTCLKPARMLGQLEHNRWNAFHFAMGYQSMTQEEFDGRTAQYKKDVAEGKTKPIRIAKNTIQKTHACLVSWEELVDLSNRENAITGGNKDYQQLDIENIMLIPKLLRIREEYERK